jgi:acetyl esterase
MKSYYLPVIVLASLLCVSALEAADIDPATQGKMFVITLDTPEHGNIKLVPEIPADGKLPAGTMINVTATPDAGYAFDSGYYATPGRWGKMYYESMTPTFSVTADQDMFIGASFIEAKKIQGFKVIQDVFYAKPGVKKLKYDVFSPDGAKNLPGIIIIHGGGWTTNTEDIMRALARELIKEGRYVAFSIDYRWMDTSDGDSTPNTMANLIEDVYGAIAHIQEHAAEYGADPTRIVVTGDSAGGHLSAAAINMSNRIGAGGFGKQPGVFEFLPSYLPKEKSIVQVREAMVSALKAAAPSYGVFGGALFAQSAGNPSDKSALAAIAPIDCIPNISVRPVPQYLLRGTKDVLITDEAVTAYAIALKVAGQTVKYDQVEGANHAFFDWKPDAQTKATFEQYGVPYAAKMKSFFDTCLYPGK